jgi:hypothetical protein
MKNGYRISFYSMLTLFFLIFQNTLFSQFITNSTDCTKITDTGTLIYVEQLPDGNYQTYVQKTNNATIITVSTFDKEGNLLVSEEKTHTPDLIYKAENGSITNINTGSNYAMPANITDEYAINGADAKKNGTNGWYLVGKKVTGSDLLFILEVDANFNILSSISIDLFGFNFDKVVSTNNGYLIATKKSAQYTWGDCKIWNINTTSNLISSYTTNRGTTIELSRVPFKDDLYQLTLSGSYGGGGGQSAYFSSYGYGRSERSILQISNGLKANQAILGSSSYSLTTTQEFDGFAWHNVRHESSSKSLGNVQYSGTDTLSVNSAGEPESVNLTQTGINVQIPLPNFTFNGLPFRNNDGALILWGQSSDKVYFYKNNCAPFVPVPTCTSNRLQNPSFESNLSNWQTSGVEISSDAAASGTKSLKMCTQGASAIQTRAAIAGKNYQLQYTAKTAGTNQNVLSGLKFLSDSWQPLATEYSSFDSPTGFTTNFIQKTAPIGTVWVEVSIYKENDGCVYIDDLCLTEENTSNGGNSCVGNLIQNADLEDINLDNWGKLGLPILVLGGNGNGGNAIKLDPAGSRIYQTKLATAGKTYEFKAFAKNINTNVTGVLGIKFLNANWNVIEDRITTFAGTNDFLSYSVTKTAPIGTYYIEATALINQGIGEMLFDDFCLTDDGNISTFDPCLSDNNPPHFDICPSNVSISTENNSAIVTYPEPHAIDECNVTITSNFVGNNFPIGTNNVVYTAKDLVGNSSICSFTIQVVKDINSNCTDSPDVNCPVAIAKTIDSGELLGIEPLNNGNNAVYLEKNGLYFLTKNEIDNNGNLVKSEVIETGNKGYRVEFNIVYTLTEIFRIPTSLTDLFNFELVDAKRDGTKGWYLAGRIINASSVDSIYVFELDSSLNVLKKRSIPWNGKAPTFLVATNFGYFIDAKTPLSYTNWTTLWIETGATDLIKKEYYENLISIKRVPFGTNLYLISSDFENLSPSFQGLSTKEYRRNKTLFEFSGQNTTDFNQIQNYSLVVNFGFFDGNIVSRNETQIAESFVSGFSFKNDNGIFTKTNLSNNTVVSTYNLPCKVIGAFPFENTDGSLAFFKGAISPTINFYKTDCSTNRLLASGARNLNEEILFSEKIGFLSDYTLFPNPATEMVYIKMNTPPNDGLTQIRPVTTIKLLNQLGKVEKMQEFSSINEEGIHEVSLQYISNGVYFMQIETAGKRAVVKKLVVSRMY